MILYVDVVSIFIVLTLSFLGNSANSIFFQTCLASKFRILVSTTRAMNTSPIRMVPSRTKIITLVINTVIFFSELALAKN